ncbi:hypothetical protein ACTXT7_016579, partial [Hymenolepis weldensis]
MNEAVRPSPSKKKGHSVGALVRFPSNTPFLPALSIFSLSLPLSRDFMIFQLSPGPFQLLNFI